MKKIVITSVILLIAFTVNAQSNRSRSERSASEERKEVKRTSRSVSSSGRSSSTKYRERKSVETPSQRSDRNTRRVTTTRTTTRTTRDNASTRGSRSDVKAVHRSPSRSAIDRKDYRPRTGRKYEERRRSYTAYRPNRVVRNTNNSYHSYKPIEYRRVHHIYRRPPRHTIVWNITMYNDYRRWYPHYDLWYYPVGYHIHTVSTYDAGRYIGEVSRVYGEVHSVWYCNETDEYHLYFGAPYPYQDLTVIIEGRDGRRFSNRPVRFFTGRHIATTGLISVFEGKPEMFLKNRKQIEIY